MIENFITEYLRLTARAESPTSYLRWGAISCLSAVLRDNIWFPFPERQTRLYPNLYILLLGESGVTRKGTPFSINENLLRGDSGSSPFTKVMAGQATMQGVLRTLATTENGQPKGGSGYLLAKEAGAFFIQDPMTLGMLTDFYDFNPYYDKHLATMNNLPPIKNLCLSLLAGTNEVMFERMMDKTALEGGFIGRCVVVQETKRRHKNSGFEENAEIVQEKDWEPIKTFLKKLATVQGPVTFELAARRRYNEWYYAEEIEEYKTKTGYEGRHHSLVLKLAAVLSAANANFDGVVRINELDEAIHEVMRLMLTYKKLTYGTGIAPNSRFIILITNRLLEAKNYHSTREKILYDLHGNVSEEILDEVMLNMVHAGLVKEKSIGGMPGYQLTEKFLNRFKIKSEIYEKEKSKGATNE